MCEHDPRCSGPEGNIGHALEHLAQERWGVIGVEGDEESEPFAYTVGLTSLGKPELVVTGLPPERAAALLNLAAEALLADDSIGAGSSLRRVMQDPYRVYLLDVIDTEQLIVAHDVYGDIAALQLVWPDKHNVLPWADDYSLGRDRQPLLGLP